MMYMVYLIGGPAIAIFATYLYFYYAKHALNIKSNYFKSLSLIFVPIGLMGFMYTVRGAMALTGNLEVYMEYIPYTIIFSISITLIVLTRFVIATSKA